MKQAVDEQPDRQFQNRNKQATEGAAEPQRTVFLFFIDAINAQKCRAARQPHSPMRKPAEQHFDKAVKNRPECIHTKIFPTFFHRITANSMREIFCVYPSGERGFYESQMLYARLQGQSV